MVLFSASRAVPVANLPVLADGTPFLARPVPRYKVSHFGTVGAETDEGKCANLAHFRGKKEEPEGYSGSKVIRSYTPSPKALRRVVRPTLIRCPNLTTSKTFLPTLNGQRNSDI